MSINLNIQDFTSELSSVIQDAHAKVEAIGVKVANLLDDAQKKTVEAQTAAADNPLGNVLVTMERLHQELTGSNSTLNDKAKQGVTAFVQHFESSLKDLMAITSTVSGGTNS